MFNHVMLGSNDIQRSRRFYDAVLGVLGVGQPMLHQNATGQARLFYRHDGGTFCLSEPINGKLPRRPTVAPSASNAHRPSRCSNFTIPLWRTAAPRSRSRPGCARAPWAPWSWPMCVTRTGTSCAPFIGPRSHDRGTRRLFASIDWLPPHGFECRARPPI